MKENDFLIEGLSPFEYFRSHLGKRMELSLRVVLVILWLPVDCELEMMGTKRSRGIAHWIEEEGPGSILLHLWLCLGLWKENMSVKSVSVVTKTPVSVIVFLLRGEQPKD